MVEFATQQPWAKAPVCFLLDSHLPRQTEPLVKWFLSQAETPVFSKKLQEAYLPAHELLVQAWLGADEAAFWENLLVVSAFQLANFIPMIPANLRQIWQAGLQNGQYALKICGAGGGGFMLGFSKNAEELNDLMRACDIRFFNIPPAETTPQ